MPTQPDERRSPRPGRSVSRAVGLPLAVVATAVPWVVSFEGLSPAGHRMLSVFLAAIVLWVFEVVPLHATALGIIVAQVLLISDAGLALPDGFEPPAAAAFYGALAHPVVILFLGGFVLAEAAAKYRLDRNLARVLLRPFGERPPTILLGLMLITAALSMFMSNTATTAAMLAIVIPVLTSVAPGDPLRAGLVLAVPVAANVGGMGTPVGTPPNAIAIGALSTAGVDVSFVEWTLMLAPLMLLTLVAAWLLLVRTFRSGQQRVQLRIDATFDRSRDATTMYVVATVTILLWLTEAIHGVPADVVALGAVVVLAATGVFSIDDAKRLQWHVLWLVGGGIALGAGVQATGLDVWLIGLVRWEVLPQLVLLVVMVAVALTASTIMSNSAVANLLVPVGVTLAASPAISASPLLVTTLIAVGCSLAMALPVSTPPNAVAYATGAVSTRDLVRVGVPVGLVGAAIFLALGPPWWDLLGVLPE